jgi:4-diphosphocytidyl-2C-methyl-D-erythritol kinase
VLYPQRSGAAVVFPDEGLVNELEAAAREVCDELAEVAWRVEAAGLGPIILCGSGAASYVKVDDPGRMAETGERLRALGLGRILQVRSLRDAR